MPRAVWRGSISFGLVNVPVRLYSATADKQVHFNQIDEKSGSRIRHKRVAEKTGREVPDERIANGYEVTGGHYVVLTDEEMQAAEPARTHTVDVEDFVALDDIDPLHFNRSYWVVPDSDEGAKRAYALLRDAMETSGKVAIGRFVMRTKEHLVTIRSLQNALVLHTMRFADEIVKASSLDGLPVRVKAGEREIKAAKQLIASLTTDWEPARLPRPPSLEAARDHRAQGEGRGDRGHRRAGRGGRGLRPHGRARGEREGVGGGSSCPRQVALGTEGLAREEEPREQGREARHLSGEARLHRDT